MWTSLEIKMKNGVKCRLQMISEMDGKPFCKLDLEKKEAIGRKPEERDARHRREGRSQSQGSGFLKKAFGVDHNDLVERLEIQ